MMDVSHARLAGRRILVVEDDYFAMRDLCAGLAALGAVVVGPAPTVAEALALVAREPDIDAAVLDVNLRGETVYPVADAMAARGMPFVLSTGYADDVIEPRFRQAPHCEKPVDMRAVGRALAAAMRS